MSFAVFQCALILLSLVHAETFSDFWKSARNWVVRCLIRSAPSPPSPPQPATCFTNNDCLAFCANVSAENWTLPAAASAHASCSLPPTGSHVALCVGLSHNATDESTDVAVSHGALFNMSAHHNYSTVHSGPMPIGGGFAWCLARNNDMVDDNLVTTDVVAAWHASQFIAFLHPQHRCVEANRNTSADVDTDATTPPSPCSGVNETASIWLRFTSDGSLLGISSAIALFGGIVCVCLCLGRTPASVKVITIGSTSQYAVEQLATWLGLHRTPVRGVYESALRSSLRKREPGTIVFYCYVGRPMESDCIAMELRQALEGLDNVARSRAVCVVMRDTDGSQALQSRLMEEHVVVVEVALSDSSAMQNAAKCQILNIVC